MASQPSTQAQMEYIRRHNVAQLIDNICVELLEHQPADPIDFIKNMNINLAAPERAVSFKVGSEKRARASSVANTLANVPALCNFSPRNLSRAAKEDYRRVRDFRRTLFDSYRADSMPEKPPVKCAHFGCVALAASYLLHGSSAQPPSARVTPEDVFFHARLPLHYANNSAITLDELHDVVLQFLSSDCRMAGTTVSAVHFDTIPSGDLDLVNVSGSFGGSASSATELRPVVTLPVLRYLLENCAADDKRVLIFNYDVRVVEEAALLEEENDEDEDYDDDEEPQSVADEKSISTAGAINKQLATRVAPPLLAPPRGGVVSRNSRGVYGVVVDFNPVAHSVTLAEVVVGEQGVQLQYRDVMLSVLHRAASTVDQFNRRPRGFVELRRRPG
eukprot:RCo003954